MHPNAPYLRTQNSTTRIMWDVCAALLPALVAATISYGPGILLSVAFTIVGSCAGELLVNALPFASRRSLRDGSAVLCGLLLGFSLPPGIAWYLALGGGLAAVIIGKHLFGGLGNNVFNPALFGRWLLFVFFPVHFAAYRFPSTSIDALSSATPLSSLQSGAFSGMALAQKLSLYRELLLGNHGGSIGESSVLALLLGGAFLLWRGHIGWQAPVGMLISVLFFGWMLGGSEQLFTGDGVLHLLSGGVMLGAFFMITDYVTTPMIGTARLWFGISCGLLTILIRCYTPLPEGVMYAILLLNPAAAFFDRTIYRIRTGAAHAPTIFSTVSGRFRTLKLFLTGTIFVLIALHLLGPVFVNTIEARRQRAQHRAQLLQKAQELAETDQQVIPAGSWQHNQETLNYFALNRQGKTEGYIVESAAPGYGGIIRLLVSITTQGMVASILITAQNETPNLGSRITENEFQQQFVGKSLPQLQLSSNTNPEGIVAITAATISSRAVAEQAVAPAVAFVNTLR